MKTIILGILISAGGQFSVPLHQLGCSDPMRWATGGVRQQTYGNACAAEFRAMAGREQQMQSGSYTAGGPGTADRQYSRIVLSRQYDNTNCAYPSIVQDVLYSMSLTLQTEPTTVHNRRQEPGPAPRIIPEPVSLKQAEGFFELKAETGIVVASANDTVQRIARWLSQKLSVPTGYPLPVHALNAASDAVHPTQSSASTATPSAQSSASDAAQAAQIAASGRSDGIPCSTSTVEPGVTGAVTLVSGSGSTMQYAALPINYPNDDLHNLSRSIIQYGALRSVAPLSASAQTVQKQGSGNTQPIPDVFAGQISLRLAPVAGNHPEGYLLEVSPSQVVLTASAPAGLFYAAQTLLQLLPPPVESSKTKTGVNWQIPAVRIEDHPRFAWRGAMLDVSRHFFSKQEVKAFIDRMVVYKFNLLHLHLTDDQGWRLEIKSLPRLTEVGAWRPERTGKWLNRTKPAPDEPKTYGGYFTHEDIRELVNYAADRFVAILPEIDVPGHSLAAVAAYPELSCTPGTYQVNAGEKLMNWHSRGFDALIDNTLCPANEKVYTFLDKVFTEVAELFPFEYIHMGGDECARNFWQKSAAVKQLMAREGLKDMHAVQSYFVKRVAKIIESKGKKMIGWDEILQGGLPPGAAVMSWRGMKGGTEAAKKGHRVVMSPSNHVYYDLAQGDRLVEPPTYSQVLLRDTYRFEPVPSGVPDSLILGGQGNLWTEQIQNMRHGQYMMWPRALAVAETLWSPKAKKNWEHFIGKVENEFVRLDRAQVKYSRSMYDPVVQSVWQGNKLYLDIDTQIAGLNVHYSFDGSYPDQYYPRYTKRLPLPDDAADVYVVSYRDGEQVGKLMRLPVADLKKRAVKK